MSIYYLYYHPAAAFFVCSHVTICAVGTKKGYNLCCWHKGGRRGSHVRQNEDFGGARGSGGWTEDAP